MAKTSNKTNIKDNQKSFLVKKVAEIHKVTPRYVNYIISGERRNDEIFLTYLDVRDGTNALIEEVKKLIG